MESAILVSIPLESGHVVMYVDNDNSNNNAVSIPLESGHVVIDISAKPKIYKCFNPLRIGSCCNINELPTNITGLFQSP